MSENGFEKSLSDQIIERSDENLRLIMNQIQANLLNLKFQVEQHDSMPQTSTDPTLMTPARLDAEFLLKGFFVTE